MVIPVSSISISSHKTSIKVAAISDELGLIPPNPLVSIITTSQHIHNPLTQQPSKTAWSPEEDILTLPNPLFSNITSRRQQSSPISIEFAAPSEKSLTSPNRLLPSYPGFDTIRPQAIKGTSSQKKTLTHISAGSYIQLQLVSSISIKTSSRNFAATSLKTSTSTPAVLASTTPAETELARHGVCGTSWPSGGAEFMACCIRFDILVSDDLA